jgi:hypothetical protein
VVVPDLPNASRGAGATALSIISIASHASARRTPKAKRVDLRGKCDGDQAHSIVFSLVMRSRPESVTAMKSDSSGSLDRHADDEPETTKHEPTPETGGDCVESLSSGGESEESGVVDATPELLDFDVQQRLWLKAVVPLLQIRSQEPDSGGVIPAASSRVQFAFDRMYIAACERISRILRSDLPSEEA